MPTTTGAAGTALVLALVGASTGMSTPAESSRVAPPTPHATSATAAYGPLDSLTISYEVAGLKVIHRPASVTDVVAVNLYLLGGSRQYATAPAGIEPFLLNASEYGTARYPGDATRRALAHTGSWITVSSTRDYTRYSFRGVKQEFDSTWAVFAERLMHPTLDSAALAITRGQFLISIKAERESPDAHAARLADSLAFEGHPYAMPEYGTVESITSLTADALKKYLAEQMMTSRMLLVVVGDIPRAQVERAVTATIGTLPRGSFTWTLPPEWPARAPRVTKVHRKLPTNYMMGFFSGPLQSSEDYPAFAIAVNMLGAFVFDDVRNEGLSYAAGSPLIRTGAAGGSIYVSTTTPDTVVRIIQHNINFLQEVAIPRQVFVKHSKSYLDSYYYQTESNAELADVLAQAQLYRGDFRSAASYGDVLRKISGTDIKSVARKYMKNIQYAYVGDTLKAPVKTMLKTK